MIGMGYFGFISFSGRWFIGIGGTFRRIFILFFLVLFMPEEKLKGLDGWLILPIIVLFISIPILLYDIVSTLGLYEVDFLIGFLIFLDMCFIVFIVVTLVAMFNKKKYLPKLVISFYSANLIIQLVLALYTGVYTGVILPIISASIWISYFVKSKRVKNTFVK